MTRAWNHLSTNTDRENVLQRREVCPPSINQITTIDESSWFALTAPHEISRLPLCQFHTSISSLEKLARCLRAVSSSTRPRLTGPRAVETASCAGLSDAVLPTAPPAFPLASGAFNTWSRPTSSRSAPVDATLPVSCTPSTTCASPGVAVSGSAISLSALLLPSPCDSSLVSPRESSPADTTPDLARLVSYVLLLFFCFSAHSSNTRFQSPWIRLLVRLKEDTSRDLWVEMLRSAADQRDLVENVVKHPLSVTLR